MARTGHIECKGEAWDKARMRTLVRDEFACQFEQLGLTPIDDGCRAEAPETRLRFLHVHHKQQRIHGGTHDLSNLITICRAHHVQLHPHMRFEHAAQSRTYEYEMREL